MRDWTFVWIASIFEVCWVTGLKHADHWWSWLGTIIAIFVTFDMLIRSSNKLPIGTVYAVFTGLGTFGTVVVEIIVFGEPFSWAKLFFILLLLAGVIGLKVITKELEEEGAQA
ncbi:QacE family quaternary ammonium compound efflux SMR transporter [Paenibacillus sp. LMG 31460]|uniref:QacE family quaternary ammonium compound efflux SMR transporter n=2 Tax=Paenibacillus germinis TaxID=2654979 RepID=A0ABX1Z421_9BACL|nr:QacE family quaternary ammonium compound efflux SMR transporter [Paenibacillus germinis]